MQSLLQDLRYGFRMATKNVGFSAITILTLAIGIGANSAMFSVVDSVLLRPLPYKDSDRLVVVWEKPPDGERNVVSAANFLDWREQNHVFENIAATTFRSFNLAGKDRPERIEGMRVSWDFFEALGIQPVSGRSFVAADDLPGAARVALLSNGLWHRKFGADPGLIGRTLTVDGQACTVIGVMPPEFRFFGSPEMWMPIALDRSQAARDFHWLVPLARLKPGVSLQQARAEMEGIAKNIARDYPKSNKGWSAVIQPVRASILQRSQRDMVLVLFGAVGFVLLIACVNVANLLLAKAAVRQRELAVRSSLGAGRFRLVQQLLSESVLLAFAGGLLGLILAFWFVKIPPLFLPQFLVSGCAEIGIDWRVLGFTLFLSLLTGLLFGVAPAWRAANTNLHDTLKETVRGSSSGAAGTRYRDVLVAAEIALSMVLLIAAGLMARTLLAMQSVDPGFRPDHVLSMRLSMATESYPDAARVRSFYRRVLDRIGSLPGVQSASVSMTLPLQGSSFGMPFQVASHPQVPISEAPGAAYELVSHDFFRTFGVALRKGRVFSERDDESAPRVAVVNETFVKQVLPKEEPLGQRLLVEELISGKTQLGPPLAWEIVGVIGDMKFGGLNDSGVAVIYVPIMQCTWPHGALAMRTAVEPKSLAQAARSAIAEIDKDLPITGVKTMEQVVVESMSESRSQTWLIGAFAVVALALAALGIYGVMSYSVSQATHDMGVRIALGARGFDILKLVLGKGILLTGAGLAVGLGGALALTRLLSSLLFGVKAIDPLTFASVAILLGFIALSACYVPARRATRIDPIEALRYE